MSAPVSGHFITPNRCLLYPQKRTLVERVVMSALCQRQTFLYCAELKAVYPSFEARIAELIAKIDANDREIDYLNSQALPTGAERLRSAELVARGIEAWRMNQTDVVR